LQEGKGASSAILGDPHAKDPLAIAKIIHFKLAFDGSFEEGNVGPHNHEVIHMDVYKAEPGWVLMNK
jgi:hypothetical protein